MKRSLISAITLCLLAGNALAQSGQTGTYSFSLDDPMDAFGRPPVTVVSPLIFPEFYIWQPYKRKDTLFKYLCYDHRDSLVSLDTIGDFTKVRYISLFKSYTDPTQLYTDMATGQQLPLPISKIVYRYDKVGDDKWLSVDYVTNKYVSLKEYRSTIVRTDSFTDTRATGNKVTTVHRYYKVVPVKK